MSEDTKWVVRSHKSKVRKYNGQNKKDSREIHLAKNTTQKTKD